MKTIKELEIEENSKMCNNWYEEGRNDMKEDVWKLIDERIAIVQKKRVEVYDSYDDGIEVRVLEELKARING